MDKNQGLTREEKKKLTMDVAVSIAPSIINASLGSDSFKASDAVATYARDIVDAVNSILIDKTGSSL